jgi:hypothetical protein
VAWPTVREKRCGRCAAVKPATEFYRQSRNGDGLQSKCKACDKVYRAGRYQRFKASDHEKVRQWKLRNPERNRLYKVKAHLKAKYDMTLEDYERMFLRQAGVCAICERPGRRRGGAGPLEVDHDHRTGDVRGLLCGSCNVAIGLLRDAHGVVDRAARYLKGSL